jgi:hypothetical protein
VYQATTPPMARPRIIIAPARLSTIDTTLARVAPRAILTPISPVRCATM